MTKFTQFIVIMILITTSCDNKSNFEQAKKLMKKGSYQEALPFLESELQKSPHNIMDFLYKCAESKNSLLANSAGELFYLCGESFTKNFVFNESTYYFLTYYACKLPKSAVYLCSGANPFIHYWAGGKHCLPYSPEFNIELPMLQSVKICSLPNPMIVVMNQDGAVSVEVPLENYKREFEEPKSIIKSDLIIEGKRPLLLIDCKTPIGYVARLLSIIKSQKCKKVILHFPGRFPIEEGEYKIIVPQSKKDIQGYRSLRGAMAHFVPQTGMPLHMDFEKLAQLTPENLITIVINSDGSLLMTCGYGESFNLSPKQYEDVKKIVEEKMLERDTLLVVLLQAGKNTQWKSVIAVLNQVKLCRVTVPYGCELQAGKITVISVSEATLEMMVVTEFKNDKISASPADSVIEIVPYYKVEVKPSPISIPKPEYSESAKGAGKECRTIVKVLIDVDGGVIDAVILKSSGNQMLDEAALVAAKKAKFKPAKHEDKFVRVWVSIPFNFTIE